MDIIFEGGGPPSTILPNGEVVSSSNLEGGGSSRSEGVGADRFDGVAVSDEASANDGSSNGCCDSLVGHVAFAVVLIEVGAE